MPIQYKVLSTAQLHKNVSSGYKNKSFKKKILGRHCNCNSNMGNIFRVSYILQVISQALGELSLNACWRQMSQELCYLLIVTSLLNLMLRWYKKGETKLGNTNLIWLRLVFPNSFLFSYFNSNILYSVHDDLMVFCNQLKYCRMFCPKIPLLLKTCNF